MGDATVRAGDERERRGGAGDPATTKVGHALRTVWLWVQPPAGRGARRAVAGFMVIMALGRLGVYRTTMLATALTAEQYGVLLLVLGLALWINGRFRMTVAGRVVAALGAILLAGMAYDVGVVGVTALLEGWLALILLRETFTSHDC